MRMDFKDSLRTKMGSISHNTGQILKGLEGVLNWKKSGVYVLQWPLIPIDRFGLFEFI